MFLTGIFFLGIYEEHYQQITKHYEQTKNKLQSSNKELHKEALSKLEEDFETSTKLLLSSYEDYMNQIKPSPKFLPIQVEIKVPDKNWSRKHLLKPTDTGLDLRGVVEELFQKIDNPILEWHPDNFWILEWYIYQSLSFCPFSHLRHQRSSMDQEKVKIEELGIPFRHKAEYISTISLNGKLKCQSDLPQICFSKAFKEGKVHSTNYFSCSECNMNWICQSCSKVCHSGHDLHDFMLNHTPTHAYCNCKKKKCVIVH